MKNLIYTLVLTVTLTAFFSNLGYYPAETKESIGYGTQYKGDSGLIVQGDGELLADTIIEPENATEPTDAYKMTSTEETFATDNSVGDKMTSTEITTKEKNNMDGMLLSFWHGVAAVLIGETVCLMVACAWMKIHKHFPDGDANKN